MTNSDIQLHKSRAMRFLGPEGYQQLLRIAEKYFLDNSIPIPSDGVERMDSFWATANEYMRQISAT